MKNCEEFLKLKILIHWICDASFTYEISHFLLE